jgi:nitrite reductase/ring-hydroxylating ferredoxin subunit
MKIILLFAFIHYSFQYSNFFNYWHCIGINNKIDFSKPYKTNLGDLPLVLWKDSQDRLITNVNVCKHMGSALDNGKIQNGCLKCQYHGLEFSHNDRFGETINFQGKIFWSYKPSNPLPENLPFYDDNNYVKSYLQIDMDASLQDSAYNTIDVRHPEYVHSIGFGSNNPPKNIKEHTDNNIVGLDFEYESNSIMKSINNNIKSTQNSHIYIYPSFSYSKVSFEDNNLIIGVNLLPLETKKTRWFITICHNYKKSEIEKDFMKILASTILTQDYFQMKNQYIENELKKEIIFEHIFENEEVIIQLKNIFEKNKYKYPDIQSCVELYKYYKKTNH